MRASILAIALAAAVFAAAPTFAGPTDQPLAVAAVMAQQQEIRAEAQAGTGRYRDMPVRQRDELLARQAALMATLEGKQTAADFSDAEQVAIFNELEWIEATINQAEDERLVCKREKPTGSNRLATICKTVAALRREQDYVRKVVDRRAPCTSGAYCVETGYRSLASPPAR